MTEFQEFMESPEGRSMLLNEFLAQAEALAGAKRHVALLNGLTFNDLTPELWAKVVAGGDNIAKMLETVEAAQGAAGLVFDDPEAFKMVTEYVEKVQNQKESEG